MAQGFGLSWACAVCNSPVALTCGGSGPPVGTQLCRHTCDLSRDERAIHGERLGREHAHAVASPCAPAAGKLPTPTAGAESALFVWCAPLRRSSRRRHKPRRSCDVAPRVFDEGGPRAAVDDVHVPQLHLHPIHLVRAGAHAQAANGVRPQAVWMGAQVSESLRAPRPRATGLTRLALSLSLAGPPSGTASIGLAGRRSTGRSRSLQLPCTW